MRTYAYLILAVLVCSILIQPLTEIVLVCKDRIEVGAAITNSVRAAKKECYTYYSIRDLNADADREKFIEVFAQTFSKSLNLRVVRSTTAGIVFESPDGKYNTFRVNCSFTPSRYGSKQQTSIYVESSSEYKFKTKYLRDAQHLIRDKYMLNHKRWYNLSMTN